MAVEDTGIVSFIFRNRVIAVPVVRQAGIQRLEVALQPCEVGLSEQARQPQYQLILGIIVQPQHRQQRLVEAHLHLLVGEAQAIERPVRNLFAHLVERQVARLKEQRLGGDIVHIETPQQRRPTMPGGQGRREHAPLPEQLHQKRRRGALEPVGPKLAFLKQQQHIEGVVDRCHVLPAPAVAVVPVADRLTIQPRQLCREHRLEIGIGIAAKGGVGSIQGDVVEIVQPREEAHLAELGNAGEQHEGQVRVGILEHAIEVLQPLAQLVGALGLQQVVEDRLVILVDQHHDAFAMSGVGVANQRRKLPGNVGLAIQRYPQALTLPEQLITDANIQRLAVLQHAIAKAQPDHRMAALPLPLVVDIKPMEKRLAPLEEAGQGIQQQALAEAPRAREKVITALLYQPMQQGCLVDVIAPFLAKFLEGLDTDGQFLASGGDHGASRCDGAAERQCSIAGSIVVCRAFSAFAPPGTFSAKIRVNPRPPRRGAVTTPNLRETIKIQ